MSKTSQSALSAAPIYFTEWGSGRPLLLIHGIMITGEMFEPVIPDLAEHHRLIIPDLRGCGKSRQLPPPYTVKQQATDLAQMLDHLGIASADVLGYSQGGPVAQQLALDYPARVRRLILCNTYAYNMATTKEKIEGRITPLLLRILGMRKFANYVLAIGLKQVPKARADWVIDIIADQDRDLMITAWREAMAFDSRSRLAEIHCPTLIITGADDEAVPLHHAEMLHAGIQGSKLVVIEHADHALIWAHPAALVQEVIKFLDK